MHGGQPQTPRHAACAGHDACALCRAGRADARLAFPYFRRRAGACALGAVCAGVRRHHDRVCLSGKAEDGHARVHRRVRRHHDARAREHARFRHGGLHVVPDQMGGHVPRGRLFHAGQERGRLQPALPVRAAADCPYAAARSVPDQAADGGV